LDLSPHSPSLKRKGMSCHFARCMERNADDEMRLTNRIKMAPIMQPDLADLSRYAKTFL
jgi:hypothetical protein